MGWGASLTRVAERKATSRDWDKLQLIADAYSRHFYGKPADTSEDIGVIRNRVLGRTEDAGGFSLKRVYDSVFGKRKEIPDYGDPLGIGAKEQRPERERLRNYLFDKYGKDIEEIVRYS